MAFLADFTFTKRADKAVSDDGWNVSSDINALAGNDTITGRSLEISGIFVAYTLSTGLGSDTISGVGRINGVSVDGTIDTGVGNDRINGDGVSVGVEIQIEQGSIITGRGNDRINGKGNSVGIRNGGVIDTGRENDLITGVGGQSGIYNALLIDTGIGNDRIIGTGGSAGIVNFGTINTGNGNDTIIGKGQGISNFGTIDTGKGRDIVDAIDGGFNRSGGDVFGLIGSTSLGSGNDMIKGFGGGRFDGGTGKDKILFSEGTYTIAGRLITEENLLGMTMNVTNFEKIGGVNGGLFKYANGTLIVDSDGNATFAA